MQWKGAVRTDVGTLLSIYGVELYESSIKANIFSKYFTDSPVVIGCPLAETRITQLGATVEDQ